MQPTETLEPKLDSEIPTERAPEKVAPSVPAAPAKLVESDEWCDSEAPTGVAVERPLLPRPPRAPQL